MKRLIGGALFLIAMAQAGPSLAQSSALCGGVRADIVFSYGFSRSTNEQKAVDTSSLLVLQSNLQLYQALQSYSDELATALTCYRQREAGEYHGNVPVAQVVSVVNPCLGGPAD
jgi:hypothetical protein